MKTVLETLKLPTTIPKLKVEWYATGGFPTTGQLFIAREAGPELVGTMGNRTAVVNNEQIVEAVSQGVYKAVSSALGSKDGESLNLTVKIGENTITDLIVEDIRRKNRISGKTIIEV